MCVKQWFYVYAVACDCFCLWHFAPEFITSILFDIWILSEFAFNTLQPTSIFSSIHFSYFAFLWTLNVFHFQIFISRTYKILWASRTFSFKTPRIMWIPFSFLKLQHGYECSVFSSTKKASSIVTQWAQTRTIMLGSF